MIKISVDTSGPHAAVDAMVKKLSHFRRVDIGQEMSDWQVEDMNRHRPFTMRSRAKGRAATVVPLHRSHRRQRQRETPCALQQLQPVGPVRRVPS